MGLKPCPFCGCSTEFIRIIKNDTDRDGFFVYCDLCESSGSVEDTKEKAAERWNTRKWYPQGNEFLQMIAEAMTKLNVDNAHKDLFPWHEPGWKIEDVEAANNVCKLIENYDQSRRYYQEKLLDLSNKIEKIINDFSDDIED
jgi:Lar family restriction alleviation protein